MHIFNSPLAQKKNSFDNSFSLFVYVCVSI